MSLPFVPFLFASLVLTQSPTKGVHHPTPVDLCSGLVGDEYFNCVMNSGGGSDYSQLNCGAPLSVRCNYQDIYGQFIQGCGPLPGEPYNCVFFEITLVNNTPQCELISNRSNCNLGCQGGGW